MSIDMSAPLLTSAVENLNTAYTQLRELSKQKPTKPPQAQENTSNGPEALTEGDRQELGLFAEEVDDIVRRVAALQVRLERPA